MGIFDRFKGPDAETVAARAREAARHADILNALQTGQVPTSMRARLEGARAGTLPMKAKGNPVRMR